ncbi:uncharacterized protein LOC107264500 isoform X2 [Cephus cinctus]|uniref:Uncharacterized protein LOC107264500 isoform X2 n=1 Tax=Cephus cinctus TaxID=211228 RepID=A0AAJ7VY63_CEPCN|nr:uncharacterized protein LOC107264500 isoform X2 [Cephus cinctus]
MIHCGIVTVHETEKSILLLENRRTVDHMKCEMMIFFIMFLCCVVKGELCIRLLNNDAEFDAILNIPGRLWRWNSVDTKFEMIEALKYNRSAICSIKEVRDIQRQTITVIADMMPPYIMLDEHSDAVTGYIGEVWTILQKKLKFKTFFERANPASGRSLVNGKADEILAATAIHTSAASYFAYSTPVATSSYSLFILSDGSGVSTWWYIKIFSIRLWLTIIMFMIVIWGVVVLNYVLRRSVYSRTCDRHADSVMPPINFITILGGVTGQGFPRMPTSWSLRLLVLSILIMGMLIAVEFNSTLTSFLTIKGTSLPISNLEDVVKKKTHSLCLRNDSTAYIHFTDNYNYRHGP